MIEFKDLSVSDPYKLFHFYFEEAKKAKQNPINAIAISSYNPKLGEVTSRFVNLKYIVKDEWTFFTNYQSPKAKDFQKHNQISALIFWESINVQIRIKATIKKTSSNFSDEHFRKRNVEKNALAISSNQSRKVDSFEIIKTKFNKALENSELTKRPDYWGGFSFTPHYFEFWKGQKFRLNSRKVFECKNDNWNEFNLEP